ncbi:MAG: hypothetical protein QW244_02420 [Candidatus Pacearchaeota archaeon]
MAFDSFLQRGFGFGLASAVITTLGLIIGLYFSANSKTIVVAGVITIAIADALSDALGMHIGTEAEAKYKTKYIWEATFTTFLAKFFIALSFLIFIILFSKTIAVILSITYGIFLLSMLSYYISKKEKIKSYKVILEHLTIAAVVILVTFVIGKLFG